MAATYAGQATAMMTNRALKRFLRQHPNVLVATVVGLTTFALTAGYDAYYSMLGTSPGDVGHSIEEIPFTAAHAALPLLTIFLAGVALLFVPILLCFHLVLDHGQFEQEEGSVLARLCFLSAALGGAGVVAALARGGSRWLAVPPVVGGIWAGRRRVARLGWDGALWLRATARNLPLLWCAALAHSAAFFAALGVALWLYPTVDRPAAQGLSVVASIVCFAGPPITGWVIARRHRHDDRRPGPHHAVHLTAAALLTLLALSPLTVGRFNAEIARRGGVAGLLPGIANRPTICVEPRWQPSAPSPLPDRALLYLGDNDGRSRLYQPKHGPIPVPADAVVLLPVAETKCHVSRRS